MGSFLRGLSDQSLRRNRSLNRLRDFAAERLARLVALQGDSLHHPADFADRLRRQLAGQVDARNLGADRAGDPLNFEGPHFYNSEVCSHDAGRAPAARAELATVDDAVILVAAGAEHRGAAHLAVENLSVEKIRDRAAFVACGERELHETAVEPALERTFELGRALVAGKLRAALLDRQPMDPPAL